MGLYIISENIKFKMQNDIMKQTLLLFLFSILASISACAPSGQKIEVSKEAQHRTKVWLLEHHQQIEHSLINELFARSVERLTPGIQSFREHQSALSKLRLYIISSDDISAFSLCDGSIFITSKMIESMRGSDLFMAVLAHEISHVISRDACWISGDTQTELSKEIKADAEGARILYISYIHPQASLSALSLYYKNYRGMKNKDVLDTLEERKKVLSDELTQYPTISSRIPEERLFRKVQSIVTMIARSHQKESPRR